MSPLVISQTQKAFSKAACRYDRFSALQKEIGLELLYRIPQKQYQYVLDVGMGTGWLTEKCGQRFLEAKTTGLDYAPGMVACAKNRKIDFVLQADAQALPFLDEAFDLIVSNCVYQWIEDLPKAFCENGRVLKQGGDFFFTCFGPDTLKELREAIEQNTHRQGAMHHWQDLGQESIRAALRVAGFREIDICSEIRTEKFNDFSSLLHWLKVIGANRVKRPMFVGRQLLDRASAYYQDHFAVEGGVMASFEIVFGKVRK